MGYVCVKMRRGEDLRWEEIIQSGECVLYESHGISVGVSQSGVSSDTFMPGKKSASDRGS